MLYLAAFSLAAVLLFFVAAGYNGTDDHFYIEAADGWLAKIPFVGTNHWHLRHPYVLAIAASFAAFGRTEFALMLPTLVAYAAILVLTVYMIRSIADDVAAALAAILVASVPVFVIYARSPFPDEIEVALVLLSLFLFLQGVGRRNIYLFLLSGAVVGIAWLVRASCLPLIGLYGILFLIRWRAPRYFYISMAAGFLPFLLGEWVFFWLNTGNPFYRFLVDAHSLEIPSANMIGKVAHGLRPPFNIALMAKWQPNTVHVHWLIDPYIEFFVNGNYGLMFWTGIPGAIVLCTKRFPSPVRDFSRLICALAILWVLCEIWVLNLCPIPRYFGPVTWTASVMTALWLRDMMYHRKRWAVAIILVTLTANILAVSMRPDQARAERVLADYAAHSPEPVWTNLSQGAFLQDELNVTDRVHVAPPALVPSGSLYVVTKPDSVSLGIAGWEEVFRIRATPTPLLRPLMALDGVSPGLASLIRRGSPDVLVLRAP